MYAHILVQTDCDCELICNCVQNSHVDYAALYSMTILHIINKSVPTCFDHVRPQYANMVYSQNHYVLGLASI